MHRTRTRTAGRTRPFGFDHALHWFRDMDTTAFLLSSPENARRLRNALEDARNGRGFVIHDFDAFIAELGLDAPEPDTPEARQARLERGLAAIRARGWSVERSGPD